MSRQSVTVHGFRSVFRDGAGEVSASPREVAEAAVAQSVGEATETGLSAG